MLARKHPEAQTGPNEFDEDKTKSPGLFAIATGSVGTFFYACLDSLVLLFYADAVTKSLALTRDTENGGSHIAPSLVLTGHGYIQQTGEE